jgi:histidinol-phosphate aminotransferase
MGTQLTRRALLRSSVLAGATLPLLRMRNVVDSWRAAEEMMAPASAGTPVVRLSHNENPYGPSQRARKAIIAAIDKGNRYPGASIAALRQAIADYEGLSVDQILISAGSIELLGLTGLMAGMHEGTLISCHPTFDFLLSYGSQFTAQWIKVPVTQDQGYDLAGINARIDNNTRLVFICNPNNPTGTVLPKSMLEPFCKVLSERCDIYIDEAYLDFSEGGLSSSLAGLTKDNPHIIVGRTFSKIYGMAGLRVGYAIAHPDTIDRMHGLMMGAGITPSETSLQAAIASLGDTQFITGCRDKIIAAKELVYTKFKAWGVTYVPSSTNFIFFRTERFGDTDIVQALRQQNIMIRSYADVPGWARVSMGTMDEMQAFLNATQTLLS